MRTRSLPLDALAAEFDGLVDLALQGTDVTMRIEQPRRTDDLLDDQRGAGCGGVECLSGGIRLAHAVGSMR